eukprot:jgi/Botrbrau1/23214/Bobra.0041s0058.1
MLLFNAARPFACRVLSEESHSQPCSLSRTRPQDDRHACKHRLRHRVSLRAASVDSQQVGEEEDLIQIEGREQWYMTKFVADDAPDWNPAKWLRSSPAKQGLREVVLEVEISRERVPLRNGYVRIGQQAQVRINGGQTYQLTVANPPFPLELNRGALLRARNDISANEVKTAVEAGSVRAPLHLLLSEKEAPEVFKLSDSDLVECGPFLGGGIDLREITPIFMYPTIIIFAEGHGIATARALIEAEPNAGGLNFGMRSDVRLYYRAPTEEALCFKELFPEWEGKQHCQVKTATRSSFQDMFDDDDTLAYEPSSTAAIILTGGDAEAEKAARKVCAEAEITCITSDSVERAATIHTSSGSAL